MTEAINDVTKTEDYQIEFLSGSCPQPDLEFKITFLGDSKVGKSCLILKAIKDFFNEVYEETIGANYFTSNIKINDKVANLQILDFSGHEKFRSLISSLASNVCLAVLVYAIDNKESFNHIDNWPNELKNIANLRKILVGNKSDLEGNRKVTKEEGENYKETHNFDLFMETSAKTGINARNILAEAAKILYNNYNKLGENSNDNKDKSDGDGENNSAQKKNDELTPKMKSLEINSENKNNEKINILEDLNNQNFLNYNQENAMAIAFTSVDKEFIYPMLCKKSDKFSVLEEKLYEKYPQYGDKSTFFIVGGKFIKRFKTLEENEIKCSDVIILHISKENDIK